MRSVGSAARRYLDAVPLGDGSKHLGSRDCEIRRGHVVGRRYAELGPKAFEARRGCEDQHPRGLDIDGERVRDPHRRVHERTARGLQHLVRHVERHRAVEHVPGLVLAVMDMQRWLRASEPERLHQCEPPLRIGFAHLGREPPAERSDGGAIAGPSRCGLRSSTTSSPPICSLRGRPLTDRAAERAVHQPWVTHSVAQLALERPDRHEVLGRPRVEVRLGPDER